MEEVLPESSSPSFEEIKHVDDNGEFWLARELAEILGYKKYDNFIEVGKKAVEACKQSGFKVSDHFAKTKKMVDIGSNAKRPIDDVKLSRYACYLIVQNGDPKKEVIALGQTYFAVQTRMQEISQMAEYNALETEYEKRFYLRNQLKEHNKQLSSAAKNAGVIDPTDYAIFKNWGYKGLYDGLDRKGIQKIKGLPEKADILDHMGSTELAANLFLATQTEEKLKKDNIKSKQKANETHFAVGKKIRITIKEIGGTMPEDLPKAESIKAIEKQTKKDHPAK